MREGLVHELQLDSLDEESYLIRVGKIHAKPEKLFFSEEWVRGERQASQSQSLLPGRGDPKDLVLEDNSSTRTAEQDAEGVSSDLLDLYPGTRESPTGVVVPHRESYLGHSLKLFSESDNLRYEIFLLTSERPFHLDQFKYSALVKLSIRKS